jgi:hypothetical protein
VRLYLRVPSSYSSDALSCSSRFSPNPLDTMKIGPTKGQTLHHMVSARGGQKNTKIEQPNRINLDRIRSHRNHLCWCLTRLAFHENRS